MGFTRKPVSPIGALELFVVRLQNKRRHEDENRAGSIDPRARDRTPFRFSHSIRCKQGSPRTHTKWEPSVTSRGPLIDSRAENGEEAGLARDRCVPVGGISGAIPFPSLARFSRRHTKTGRLFGVGVAHRRLRAQNTGPVGPRIDGAQSSREK